MTNRIKAKVYLYTTLLVLTTTNVFSAGPAIDFDGKSREIRGMKTFVAENATVSLPVPANETDSELVVKREILTENGEWVELKPIKNWIESGVKYHEYTIRPGWACRWSLRCVKGNWTLKKTYNFWNDQYGGHYHSDPPPPALSVSSVSLSASTAPFHTAPSPIIFPEMKGNTTYYYWEWYPVFATKVQEQLEAYGACQGMTQTDYTDVKIPGLLEMREGKNYILYNSEAAMGYHPDNHYGTQNLIDNLKTIADGYRAVFPNAAPIQINDMSLPWGGVFDINQNWKKPFFGHDFGIDADINKTTVPLENRQKLLEIMCRNADTYSEEDLPGEAPYFHVRVFSGTTGVLTGGEDSKIFAKCCKGNEIDPANLQICVSTQTSTAREP